MSVASFLNNHPVFANYYYSGQTRRANEWLRNHPDAAARWAAAQTAQNNYRIEVPAGPEPSSSNFDQGPPVYAPAPAPEPEPPAYVPYFGDIDQEETEDDWSLSQFMQDAQDQENQAVQRWTTSDRDVREAAPAIYRRILNTNAARGTAFSSQQNLQDTAARSGVSRTLADLANQLTTARSSIEGRRTTARSAREARRARRAERRAARAAGNPYA